MTEQLAGEEVIDRPTRPSLGRNTYDRRIAVPTFQEFAPLKPVVRRVAPRLDPPLLTTTYRVGDTVVAVIAFVGVVIVATAAGKIAGIMEALARSLSLNDLVIAGGLVVVSRGVFLLCDMYRPATSVAGLARRAIIASTIAGIPAFGFLIANMGAAAGLRWGVYFWAGMASAVFGLRLVVGPAARKVQGRRVRSVIIVGSGHCAVAAFREMSRMPDLVRVIGFVDSNDEIMFGEVRQRMIGRLEELETILMRTVVDEVIVALPIKSQYASIQRALDDCERAGVEAKYPADLFSHKIANPRCELSPTPMVAMKVVNDDRIVLKRAFDIFASAAGLIVFAPLLAVVAIGVKVTSPGPIFFVQERYGLRKRRFKMYKFRTMKCGAEALQAALEDCNEATGPVFKIRKDPRFTPIGRFLRVSSLDELPQLWNVLRGEMSLVGPRPMAVRDVSLFSEPWLMRRFSVRPGITGLWQVSGRSDLPFSDWMRLDLEYIDRWSLGLDARILARTVPAVLSGTGAV